MAVELAQGKDCSATLAQEDFAKNLEPFPTPPELRAGRKEPLSLDGFELRQSKLGELCRVATVSRPDIRARLARIASRINPTCGGEVYRINEPIRSVRERRKAAALKYPSPSRPWGTHGGGDKAKDDLRNQCLW